MKPLIYEPKSMNLNVESMNPNHLCFFLRFILTVLFDCKSNTNLATPQ